MAEPKRDLIVDGAFAMLGFKPSMVVRGAEDESTFYYLLTGGHGYGGIEVYDLGFAEDGDHVVGFTVIPNEPMDAWDVDYTVRAVASAIAAVRETLQKKAEIIDG